MMKFLTIIFLTFYIVKLFTGFKGTKKLLIDASKLSEKEDKVDFSKLEDSELSIAINFLIRGCLIFILQVIEFFYIFFATSHGNTYITIGFIILWMFLWIKYLIKNKKRAEKGLSEKECDKLLRFSISEFIINLIDVAYFAYMFFELFIR